MKKLWILTGSHVAALALGFALGVYLLPILSAPPPIDRAALNAAAADASFRAQFRKDLPGSDALHWGEGQVSVGPTHVTHIGTLAPGPAYRLYLTPEPVDTEEGFRRVKAASSAVADIRSFDGFIAPLPQGVDLTRYRGVVIWCEAFHRFITAAPYR